MEARILPPCVLQNNGRVPEGIQCDGLETRKDEDGWQRAVLSEETLEKCEGLRASDRCPAKRGSAERALAASVPMAREG